MMVSLRFGDTFVNAVTDVADTYTQTRPNNAVIILSDRITNLAIGRNATTDDFMLKADTYFVVNLVEGETLSYILATGESDGTIRLTEAL